MSMLRQRRLVTLRHWQTAKTGSSLSALKLLGGCCSLTVKALEWRSKHCGFEPWHLGQPLTPGWHKIHKNIKPGQESKRLLGLNSQNAQLKNSAIKSLTWWIQLRCNFQWQFCQPNPYGFPTHLKGSGRGVAQLTKTNNGKISDYFLNGKKSTFKSSAYLKFFLKSRSLLEFCHAIGKKIRLYTNKFLHLLELKCLKFCEDKRGKVFLTLETVLALKKENVLTLFEASFKLNQLVGKVLWVFPKNFLLTTIFPRTTRLG